MTVYDCKDCSAWFRKKEDAANHKQWAGHDIRFVEADRTPAADQPAVDRQKPRGKRERVLDGRGKPRGDY